MPSAAPLCPLQGEIVEWILSGEGTQLQSLHVDNPHFLSKLFNSGTPLKLPQLEVLTLPSFVGEEECVQQMLAAAPNLKRIIVLDVNVLNYMPENKYRVAHNLFPGVYSLNRK